MVANRELRDFKHNQYDMLKEKYESALDQVKIADNKFEQCGILHQKEIQKIKQKLREAELEVITQAQANDKLQEEMKELGSENQ